MKNSMQLKALIKNIANDKRVPAQTVLQNYMLERFLERVSISRYKTKFILKGGLLVAAMVGLDNRATMDMDANIKNIPLDPNVIAEIIKEIIEIKLDDQVSFSLKVITAIREEEEYEGYRVSLNSNFDGIITPLKIDISTGDVITPREVMYRFQKIFSDECIEILAYNLETVLAEKFETIIRRGLLNTRMRDLYDVYILTRLQSNNIDSKTLIDAIKATSIKRDSISMIRNADDILNDISESNFMKRLWQEYQKKYFYAQEINYSEIIDSLIGIAKLL